MLWNRRSIEIEQVDQIDISTPYHPILHELLQEHLEKIRKSPSQQWNRGESSNFEDIQPDGAEQEKSILTRFLDIAGKIISIVSGLAVVTFVGLLWSGQATIGNVSVSNLLTIFSFTLIGGIISVGGVKMFSINASLRRSREKIRKMVRSTGGCPFVYVIDDEARQEYQISSPYQIGDRRFCERCQLVDQNGRTTCKVSPYYQE